MKAIDVSFVIVSYNTRDCVRTCIDSIIREIRGVAYEIIMIDNASSDGTVAAVRAEYPEVVVIENDTNLFVPPAMNQGIRRATGRYILLTSPDLQLSAAAFDRMYAYLETHPDTGAVSPRLVDADGIVEPAFARQRTFPFFVYNYTFLKHLFPRRTKRIRNSVTMPDVSRKLVMRVEVMIDASMLARRDALKEIGLWDERFKLYFCDDDLCIRFRSAGWKLTYLGDVTNLHNRHQSVGQQPFEWDVAMYREDAIRYATKYFSASRTLLLRVLVALTAVLRRIRLHVEGRLRVHESA
jgi:hypothetical protein